ncbi:MAG: hypothetical protein ACRD6X_15905 [Pyrinomonadaceae bacterium]
MPIKYFVLILFFFVFSTVVSGQNQTDRDKGEIFVGYTSHFFVDDPGPPLTVTSRGVEVAGVYYLRRYIGIKADASITTSSTASFNFVPGFDNPTNAAVSYQQKISVSTYTAGVQFKDSSRQSRFRPFAHALFGAGRLENKVTNISCTTVSNCSNVPPNETSTGFALLLGGGLDIKINKHFDVRAAQLDLSGIAGGKNAVFFRGGSNDFKFGAGIVFKF